MVEAREDNTDVLAVLLEKANRALESAVTRIDALEKRLNEHADLVERVQQLEDAKWEDALDEAVMLNAEVITEKGLNGGAFGGRDGKWEVMTIIDNPCLVGTGDREIADALNDGWEIVNISFAQSSLLFDGLPQHDYTRCVTLKRFVLSATPTPEPKREVKEADLSALTPDPSPEGREGPEPETVIEFEPEPVVVTVLPVNMVLLDADEKPLVQFPRGMNRKSGYEEVLTHPDCGAEEMAAAAEAEMEDRVNETLRKFRAGEITFEEAISGAGRRDAQRAKWDMEFQAVKDRFVANAAAVNEMFKRPAPWAQGN